VAQLNPNIVHGSKQNSWHSFVLIDSRPEPNFLFQFVVYLMIIYHTSLPKAKLNEYSEAIEVLASKLVSIPVKFSLLFLFSI
jgi:hypothetical protein